MSRKEIYKNKRKQIKQEINVTESIAKTDEKISQYISQLNTLNEKIISKEYSDDFLTKTRIKVIDNTDLSNLDALKATKDKISNTLLYSFNKDYEIYQDSANKKKTFAYINNNIEISMPAETLPYYQADARLAQFERFDLKLREFESNASAKFSQLEARLSEISTLKSSKVDKKKIKEVSEDAKTIANELALLEVNDKLKTQNPLLFEKLSVLKNQHTRTLQTRKLMLGTVISLGTFLVLIAVCLALIIYFRTA